MVIVIKKCENKDRYMKSIYDIYEVRSLKNYMSDKLTVGGTYSDRILLFDVDDTLIHSNAKIGVIKNGEKIKELTPAEFNYYKLGSGESYDFEQFRSYEGLLDSEFLPFWKTMKREYNKGTHVGILTAREDGDMFKKFFLNHGIDIKDELIFTTGDPDYDGSVENRKTQAIERLIKVGYKTFVFFDDSEANLREVKKMEKTHDIKVITIKA